MIEVATSNTSDFEVSEIFLRLCDDEHAEYLQKKKRYRAFHVENEQEHVLLPPYRLEYDETIRFDVKKKWIFHHITVTGVRL